MFCVVRGLSLFWKAWLPAWPGGSGAEGRPVNQEVYWIPGLLPMTCSPFNCWWEPGAFSLC